MKRSWKQTLMCAILDVHSPTLSALDLCWHQRYHVPPKLTQEEYEDIVRTAAERAWKGWSE